MANEIKTLVCACCGEYTRGRQWHNRDTGYGACPQCFKEETERSGVATAIDYYGRPGEHHTIVETKESVG